MDQPDIFIASSIDFESHNVERLIQNIRDVGNIPLERVHFIIGGCEQDVHSKTEDGITIDRTRYRCFEFTPMIYVLKNPDMYPFDYAMFIHDTVSFGPNFYPQLCRVTSFLKRHKYETARIELPLPSMNIGVYHHSVFDRHKHLLESICLYDNDPKMLWDMKHTLVGLEDKLLLSSNHYPGFAQNPTITEVERDGKRSWLKYFSKWDLYKYQSNRFGIFTISPYNIS